MFNKYQIPKDIYIFNQAEHLFFYARVKCFKALHFKAISITRVVKPILFKNYFKCGSCL